MYAWQIDKLKAGFKPGELRVIAMQRRTGKSMFTNMYLNAWGDWEPMWSWHRQKSITGIMIRGQIMMRTHLLALGGPSNPWQQFATKKEAFIERLRNG